MEKNVVQEVGGDAPMPQDWHKPDIVWSVVVELMNNPETLSKAEDLIARYVKTYFRDNVPYEISHEPTRWVNSTTVRFFPRDIKSKGPEAVHTAVDSLCWSIAAQMRACTPNLPWKSDKLTLLMTEAVSISLKDIGDSFTVTVKTQFSWKQQDE